MGHLLKIKGVDSMVNDHILASTSVPFIFATVQVSNLALTHKKRITVCPSPRNQGGGEALSSAGEGLGEVPIPTTGEKLSTVPTLWEGQINPIIFS
jgi:hypothetical protein